MTRYRLFTVLLLVLLVAVSGTGAHLTPAFGAAPKPTATLKPTNTPKPINTPRPSPTPKRSATPTQTAIPTDTPTNTPVPTDTPTDTPIPTDTPTDTPTPTATEAVQDSLLAYWKFDEGSGTTAADSSGNGDTVGLVADTSEALPPGWTTDVAPLPGDSAALTFDGIPSDGQEAKDNGRINVTYRSFSVAMWVKRARTGQQEVFFSQGTILETGYTDQVLQLGFRPSNAFFCGFYNDDLDTSAIVTDTNWHHYACTFDASTDTRKAYMDGVLVGSDTTQGAYIGYGTVHIGGMRVGGFYTFAGNVDDTRFYGIPLSDATVAALAQGNPVPTPTPGGPTPTVTPTSLNCAIFPSLLPPPGDKIPQLLTLDATGSTTTCGAPLTYQWGCQSDGSPYNCATFLTDANDNGKNDNPTPVLPMEANSVYQITLTVCAGATCGPQLSYIYTGAYLGP